MHLEQRFQMARGRPVTMRIRYHDVGPSAFSWTADRSEDAGKTWVAQFQTIWARRTGPARTIELLTPAPARPK